MICQKCQGTGKVTEYDGLRKFWCDYKCPVCHGTGEVLTNEQWFCSLPTEEKAKFLGEKVWVENNRLDYLHRAEAWKKWLKEIHHDD